MALSEDALEQIREATSAAVTAGLEPIQETITALDGRVRALEEMDVEEEEETEEVEAASDDEDEEEQDDERSKRYERACQLRDEAVRSGRRPAQVDLVVNAVFGGSRSSDPITDEQLRILEGTLRAIPVVGAGGSLREEVRTRDDKSVMLPANAFRTVGLGRDADPAKRQQLAEAMAAATDEKGNTSFSALRSEIYRQAGELMPARGNFGGRLVP